MSKGERKREIEGGEKEREERERGTGFGGKREEGRSEFVHTSVQACVCV